MLDTTKLEEFATLHREVSSKYRTVADLATQKNRFRVAFVRERRAIDGKLAELGDLTSPIRALADEYRSLRKRLDALIIGAWHQGVRPGRRGLQVIQKPGRQVWSKGSVTQACEQFGIPYEEFRRAAGLPEIITSVKIYR